MRTPDDLMSKINTRYRSVWRNALLDGSPGPYTFSLDPPTAATVTRRPAEVAAWLTQWRNWVIQHQSVSLRSATVRTTFGPQPIFTHLVLADTTGLAAADAETANHWAIATASPQATRQCECRCRGQTCTQSDRRLDR